MSNNPNNKNTGLKVALVLVSIILIISLIAVFYVYTNPPDTQNEISNLQDQKASLESQVNDLQNQISGLQTQIDALENQQPTDNQGTDLQSQLNQLQSTYDNYVSTHGYSNEEYNEQVAIVTTQGGQITALQTQVASLSAPDLVTRLGLNDERPILQTPYFHVYGEVWNVGTNTATNCKLHIVLYQGAVVAEDTYVNLGVIYGRDYASVDSQIFYQGSALTNWTLSPEWD